VVTNRTYLGHVVFGDELVRGAHEPLVDPRTFDSAQHTLPVVRTGERRAGLGSGLLLCGSCGMPLSVGQSGSTGTTFYGCRRLSAGKRCTRPVHVHKVRVDAHLDALLRDVAEGKAGFDVLRARRQLAEDKQRLQAALHDFEQFQVGTAGMSAERIAKGMRARQDAVDAAQAAYDARLAQVEDADAFPTTGDGWDGLSLEGKRLAAPAVIDHVVVAPFAGTSRALSDVESRLTVVWR
jgi:hypothetical protein